MWVQYAPNLLKPKKCLWVGNDSRKSPSRVIFPSGCSRIDQGFMHPKLSEHFPRKKTKQNKRNEETLEETGCSLPIVTSLALRESRVGSRCRCSPRPFMSHQRSKAQNLQRVTWSSEGMVMVDDLDDLDDMVSIIYPNRSLHGHPRNSATHRPNQPTRHQPNSYHRTANDSKISIARATN